MSFLKLLPDGVEVTVRATPRGGRDALDGVAELSDGRAVLKIRVKVAPEDGAATAAVARVLAQAAGVAASQVRLASGATARVKTFRIAGDAAKLTAALTQAATAPAGKGRK
ncbi:protein of unknown function DUF167 [Xanthobacter versatilis]|uniref:UPF0235 protein Xaut_0507 n=1 Tax=Xanthobacter autotrophicus (strain ATCC BAA-1158 / Py2) TaxID=78245 RepID=A7ICM2_XANP2|nr:protein of unknown function DUF167 [Xanthobacter autotrophicus Py2]